MNSLMHHVLFHRVDADGQASAAIAKLALNQKGLRVNCLPWNFGDPIPWEKFAQDEPVFVVDLTLMDNAKGYNNLELMKRLQARGPVIWIDHHHTSLEAAMAANFSCPGLRYTGAAACELTWEYFFPGQAVPMSIRHIGRNDVWDHSDPNTVIFNSGLKLYDTRPWLPIWQRLLFEPEFQQQILKEGKIVNLFETNQHRRYAKAYGLETIFADLPAIALNLGLCNSSVFKDIYDPAKHKLMITFTRGKQGWKVSLYTTHDDINCGQIAAAHYGGGHRQAAGFCCQDLPFAI